MNQSHIAMGTGSHGYTGWRERGKLSSPLLFVSVCLSVCLCVHVRVQTFGALCGEGAQ